MSPSPFAPAGCAAAPVSPQRCPLCGQPNACAQAACGQGTPGTPCWCVNLLFSAELLARVPAAARGRACICRACATASPPLESVPCHPAQPD